MRCQTALSNEIMARSRLTGPPPTGSRTRSHGGEGRPSRHRQCRKTERPVPGSHRETSSADRPTPPPCLSFIVWKRWRDQRSVLLRSRLRCGQHDCCAERRINRRCRNARVCLPLSKHMMTPPLRQTCRCSHFYVFIHISESLGLGPGT